MTTKQSDGQPLVGQSIASGVNGEKATPSIQTLPAGLESQLSERDLP